MTSGLYHFDLAIILTLFASFIFYLLYKFEYGKGKDTQILKITVPENLNHENMFDDLFESFTENHSLRQIETTNLGTMILYTYAIRSKNSIKDKERSEEHTSELQSRGHLVCRLLLEKKK